MLMPPLGSTPVMTQARYPQQLAWPLATSTVDSPIINVWLVPSVMSAKVVSLFSPNGYRNLVVLCQ